MDPKDLYWYYGPWLYFGPWSIWSSLDDVLKPLYYGTDFLLESLHHRRNRLQLDIFLLQMAAYDPLIEIRTGAVEDFARNGVIVDEDESVSTDDLTEQSNDGSVQDSDKSDHGSMQDADMSYHRCNQGTETIEHRYKQDTEKSADGYKQATDMLNVQTGSVCDFCFNNGEDPTVYRSHSLNDEVGRTACPILRQFSCPSCGTAADFAHIFNVCPLTGQEIRLVPAVFPTPVHGQYPPDQSRCPCLTYYTGDGRNCGAHFPNVQHAADLRMIQRPANMSPYRVNNCPAYPQTTRIIVATNRRPRPPCPAYPPPRPPSINGATNYLPRHPCPAYHSPPSINGTTNFSRPLF